MWLGCPPGLLKTKGTLITNTNSPTPISIWSWSQICYGFLNKRSILDKGKPIMDIRNCWELLQLKLSCKKFSFQFGQRLSVWVRSQWFFLGLIRISGLNFFQNMSFWFVALWIFELCKKNTYISLLDTNIILIFFFFILSVLSLLDLNCHIWVFEFGHILSFGVVSQFDIFALA